MRSQKKRAACWPPVVFYRVSIHGSRLMSSFFLNFFDASLQLDRDGCAAEEPLPQDVRRISPAKLMARQLGTGLLRRGGPKS